jgi:2-polyprenyl-6-hydroxyphenyl methylase / 3-demethylubiquinone-9 3-methyltransferase
MPTAMPPNLNTIDPREATHFGGLAEDWWDPSGSSALLHKINPVRLSFVRQMIDSHWGVSKQERHPLAGKTALDVGCGAGLLAEPLARMGGHVLGIDAAPENVAVAVQHAAEQALKLDYRCVDIAALEGQFDLVTCMEVIEHVIDPKVFFGAFLARLSPGGLMIVSTPNRTALSRTALITLGEGFGQIPKGTHDWHKFLTPSELTAIVEDYGLKVVQSSGLSFNPAKGFQLSADMSLNYLLAITH